MKKILLILGIILFLGCSSDDDSTEFQSKVIFHNYKVEYVGENQFNKVYKATFLVESQYNENITGQIMFNLKNPNVGLFSPDKIVLKANKKESIYFNFDINHNMISAGDNPSIIKDEVWFVDFEGDVTYY